MQYYNKLVRDRVPGTLRDGGLHVVTRTLRGSELLKALRAKIDEEIAEYDAAPDDQHAALELADLVEVVMALAEQRGFNEAKLQQLRKAKADQRGTFARAVFLISAE